jgi:Arc-like DNA binding domain
MVRKAQAPRIVMTRMPEGLHTRLRREAKLNARSVNAEIIHRLTKSFAQADEAEHFQQQVHSAAKTLAAALGPAALATLEKELTTEREIFNYATSDEPTSEEGSK